jgi:hypothetical protein
MSYPAKPACRVYALDTRCMSIGTSPRASMPAILLASAKASNQYPSALREPNVDEVDVAASQSGVLRLFLL